MEKIADSMNGDELKIISKYADWGKDQGILDNFRR